MVGTLAGFFEVEGDFAHLPKDKLDSATAMIFAGLMTPADWISLNADFFKCEVEGSTKPFSLAFDAFAAFGRTRLARTRFMALDFVSLVEIGERTSKSELAETGDGKSLPS